MWENTHSALLEPTGRVELPTSRLRIGCSTTELRRLSHRLRNFSSRHRGLTSENKLPGALEEDELPAVVFIGAVGTIAIGARVLQAGDELDLVAETSRPVFGRSRCFPR